MKVSSVSRATAAALTVTIGGKDWQLSPLRIKAFGELEQWLRSKLVQIGRDAIRGQGLTDDERRAIMDAAFRRASMVCLIAAKDGGPLGADMEQTTTAMLSSADGLFQIVKLSLSRKHRDLTDDQVEDILDDPDVDAKGLVEEIMRISGQDKFRVDELPGRGLPGGAAGPGGLPLPGDAARARPAP